MRRPARAITVFFDQPADGNPPPADAVVTGGYFQNMNDLWHAPSGVEIEGTAGFNVGRCNIVRFNPAAFPGSDRVLIHRLDATTWRVRTKPFPDNKAWCDNDGRLYHLPFELVVRQK